MEKLRAKRHVKISELAEQFHVSERTVRNDIVRRSEIYPIYTTQGRERQIWHTRYYFFSSFLSFYDLNNPMC